MKSIPMGRKSRVRRTSRALSVFLTFLFAVSILSSCEYTPVILWHNPELSANGTTILSVWMSGVMQGLDIEGNVLWRVDGYNFGLDFEILDNWDILTSTTQDEIMVFREGSALWSIAAPGIHHCITQMPNGHIMYLSIYYMNVEGWDKPFRADCIREVDPLTEEIVWEWRIGDHLSTDDYCPVHIHPYSSEADYYDWTHSNTVVYREEESAVYLNTRHLDRMIKIDYPSGNVLWSMGAGGDFGEGLLYHAHDPQFLDNGNVLFFDNGNHREPIEYSRAVEIAFDPDLGWAEEAWQWPSTPIFYDSSMGDANRLPNGNTLITSPHHGTVYEVTPSGQIAWLLFLDSVTPFPEGLYLQLYKAEMVFPPPSMDLRSIFGLQP